MPGAGRRGSSGHVLGLRRDLAQTLSRVGRRGERSREAPMMPTGGSYRAEVQRRFSLKACCLLDTLRVDDHVAAAPGVSPVRRNAIRRSARKAPIRRSLVPTMRHFLEFEKSVADVMGKVEELRALRSENGEATVDVGEEIVKLEAKAAQALSDIYAKLTPWQKTMVARHPDRPHAIDYVAALFEEFTPLAGDRKYAEDHAIVSGLGRFRGRSVVVLGQEKGADTQSRLKRNFGMVRPEGYRKAVRLMEMAERFAMPVISFVDTAGAYPGIGAEERGQAEAIARSTEKCLELTVPSVAVIIGEGGSGGAIALAAASRVFMLEHAIYSVISPEGAASILWHDAARAQDAASSMKITAQDILRLGIIDGIIEEPLGGAHRDRDMVIGRTGETIAGALEALEALSPADRRRERVDRFLAIGRAVER